VRILLPLLRPPPMRRDIRGKDGGQFAFDAFQLAGVLVGPYTPGFVADPAMAAELAEIGVILLMFGVGLHFSLHDLLSVRDAGHGRPAGDRRRQGDLAEEASVTSPTTISTPPGNRRMAGADQFRSAPNPSE
jgi:hypothetical protein